MSLIDQYPLTPEVKAFLAREGRLLIGDRWCSASDGGLLSVFDPSSGEMIARVAAGTAADIDAAVNAATTALPVWQALSPADRASRMWELTRLIARDADHLAQLDTLNVGLPLEKTRHGEIPACIEDLQYYAGWATKLQGRTIPVGMPGFAVQTRREPMGVCGAITPWNYPMEAFSGKVGPALACGNTLVLKPAEVSPLTALWLGALALEAGIPAGVLNIVTGLGDVAGAALAAHPGVAKIGFTGSTDVGRKLVVASAGNLKRISLELGGKSPNIIMADADLEKAVAASAMAIHGHAGQNCIAGSRIFVQRAVHDQVVAALTARTSELRVRTAFDPSVEIGPLVSARQRARVAAYIEAGRASGGEILCGGGVPAGVPETGFFMEPTLFAGVSESATLAREEIFGPVATIFAFDDLDEAIARGNDTDYGLAASIWTRDISTANRFADRIQAGIVWINGHGIYDSAAPFGGYKQSGYGRDLGEASLDEYTQVKTVWTAYDA